MTGWSSLEKKVLSVFEDLMKRFTQLKTGDKDLIQETAAVRERTTD